MILHIRGWDWVVVGTKTNNYQRNAENLMGFTQLARRGGVSQLSSLVDSFQKKSGLQNGALLGCASFNVEVLLRISSVAPGGPLNIEGGGLCNHPLSLKSFWKFSTGVVSIVTCYSQCS